MNPFDEIAVEEAVRLKAKGAATDVIAVSAAWPRARKPCEPCGHRKGTTRPSLLASCSAPARTSS